MEKVKRNVRMAIIAQRLTDTPNQIHTLSEFASLFGAAKSTISEDITLLAEAFGQYGGGAIETVPGAAGGVRYRAILSREQMEETVLTLCEQLKDPARILPGGFLYTSDLSSDPGMATRVGAVFSTSTKEDAKPISHETLKAICQAVSIPVCAIGGISKENILELSGSGVDGVALVSAIFSNPDIESACRQLRALSEKMTER